MHVAIVCAVFCRQVASLRGVYITSVIDMDDSIMTRVTYDRGGVWQPIKRSVTRECVNEHKVSAADVMLCLLPSLSCYTICCEVNSNCQTEIDQCLA